MTSTRLRRTFRRFAATAVLMLACTPAAAAPLDDGRPMPPRREDVLQLKAKMKKAAENGQLPLYFPLFAWNSPKVCSYGASAAGPGAVTRESNYFGTDRLPAIVTTWDYDRLRNVTAQVITHFGFDGTGPPNPIRTECVYEDRGDLVKGKLLRMLTTRRDRTVSYRAAYDANDRHELEIEETDHNLDGNPDLAETTRYAYDAAGRLVRQDYDYDFRADGVIEFRTTTHATYDARNRVQRLVQGYYDGPGGTFLPHTTYVVTFDDTSRLVVATNEIDYDRDGATDDTFRDTVLTDATGRPLRHTHEADFYGRPDGYGDGKFDWMFDDRYEYDASGYLVRNVLDNVADGTLDSRSDYQFVNDRHGRVMQTIFTLTIFFPDYLGLPPQVEIETTVHLRDEHGRVIEEHRQKPYGPTLTIHSRTQYVYDALGNLLERSDSWWANDDPPTPEARTVYEHGAGQSGQVGGGS